MEKTASEEFRIRDKVDFEVLFRTHYSTLCGYANFFLKDADASEEIVQEVMFRIWINRDSVHITTSIRGYLFRAVRNGCMNLLKHLDVREEYKTWNEGVKKETEPSAEDLLIVSELDQKIREAIERLPLERRKIFILSRYDGLTYAEIASRLSISVRTVENQIGKALKNLREELADYLPLLILLFFDIFKNS